MVHVWLFTLVSIGLLSGCRPQVNIRCGDGPPRHLQPGLIESSGQVYLSAPDAQTMYAVRASDGVTLWHHSPALFLLASDAEVIYLQSGPYAISALRASDGKTLWSKQSYDLFGSTWLTEAHGTLYTYQSSAGGVLHALQGDTGVQRWQTHLPPPALPPPAALQVTNGAVYVLSHSGQLLALSEQTGTGLWQADLAPSSAPNAPVFLVLPQGVIYAYTTELQARRASDGQLLWQNEDQGLALPPAIQDEGSPALLHLQGILYLRTLREIDAFRASDGQLLWSHSAGIYATAQLGDGILYTVGSSEPGFGGRDVVEALRASDGHLLWRYQASASSIQLFVTAANLLTYLLATPIGGASATLLAKQATDGTLRWESSVKAASMLLADGSLYLGLAGNSDGTCYAIAASQMEKLRPADGTPIWQIHVS